MNVRQDPDRRIAAWLRDEATEPAPARLLAASREQIRSTHQRRSWGPAWRYSDMNNTLKVALGVAAVLVVAVAAFNLLPGDRSGAGGVPPSPSMSPTVPPSPSTSPTQEPSASLVTHTFGPGGFDDENPRAASITFTFDAPASWELFGELGVWIDQNAPPDGANLFFYPGGDVFSDPCLTDEEAGADIPVGPTVDDLVTALVDHPSLDVTEPVNVSLAGYSGKYLDLLIPDDISACAIYQPMDGHHYAQGPGQRWHMWILDVDGVRVLVETNDFAGTSAQRLAEEQAMIDSLEITP